MVAKFWVGWGVALAAAIGMGPLLLGRGDPRLQSSLDEVARMSEVERAVLQRKYDQYRAMTEAERAKLREMHRLLEVDRTDKGRHVAVLDDYCDWLKLIDAWEQDDLAHLADPQAKVKRVQEIVERQQADSVADADDEDYESPGPQWLPPLLSEEELTRAFDSWAKRLTNLSSEEQAEIDSRHGLQRYGTQVRYLKKTVGVGKSNSLLYSISDSEFIEMVVATGNKVLLERGAAIREPAAKRRFASMCIVASCVEQFKREGAKTTDAELEKFFETLAREQQDELLQLGASDFKTQLRLLRLEQQPEIQELKSLVPNFSAAMQMLKRLREGGFRPGDNEGGPPFGPPRERPGERLGDPRFEQRREGERRDGERSGRLGGQRPFRPGDRSEDNKPDDRRPGEPPLDGPPPPGEGPPPGGPPR